MKFKIYYILLIFATFLLAETDFSKRFYTNLNGNVKVIGNTILQSNDPSSTLSNAQLVLKYVDVDSDSNTFNSSSATVESILNGVKVDKSKIVWAGLYWSGYLHSDNRDIGIDSIYNFSYYDVSEIENYLNNHKILLKVDDENYIEIKPDTINKVNLNLASYYQSLAYSAFADVTNILKDRAINHKYTVANIPTRTGQTFSGYFYDGLGNFSAWALVIVYDNSKEAMEKTRNVTIFDGFKSVSRDNPYVQITFDGFKTPRYAPDGVDSEIAIFAAEGDRYISGDKAKLINQDGEEYLLPYTTSTNNYFASSIDGVPTRDPIIINNNGIDIHINQIGTKGGDDKPIKTNQTKADLILDSEGDMYFPIMATFSTELYTPKVCYDYDIKLGSMDVESENRYFMVHSLDGEDLMVKVMIRSEEADFDLINSKLKIKFNPDGAFSYKKGSAQYSPPNVYEYLTAIETDSAIGEITIGKDVTTQGGTISAKETTYAKFFYQFKESDFNGTFDIYLDANISFDGVTQVNYSLSTDAPDGSISQITRCPRDPIYRPIYGMFNIERGDSTFTQDAPKRYSLYTQVVGVPYEISIASYEKDDNGEYTKASKVSTNLELELIRGDSFENNSSAGYDSICQEPDRASGGVFIQMRDSDRVKIKIPEDFPEYPTKLAVKNAIFRVWALTKEAQDGRVLVSHDCKSQNDSLCFDEVYKTHYKDYEDNTTQHCFNDCSNSSGTTCYDCLKKHFGTPICSRDNFAIRPESFNIILSDDNETNSKDYMVSFHSSKEDKESPISAGYLYRLDMNATIYNSIDNVTGYYLFSDNSLDSKKETIVKFTGDQQNCYDTNSSYLNISVYDGKILSHQNLDEANISYVPENGLIINNTGSYTTHIRDSSWTVVDQEGYEYKPFRDLNDCIKDSTEVNYNTPNGLRGCDIRSDHPTFYDLKLTLHPYRFMGSVKVVNSPNSDNSEYLFINDIEKSIYMSLLLYYQLYPVGKNGTTLTNYTAQCSSKDIDVNTYYQTEDAPTDIEMTLKNAIGEGDEYANFNNLIFSEDNNTGIYNYRVPKEYFHIDPASNIEFGFTKYRSFFNFNRYYNQPINPFKFILIKSQFESLDDSSIADLNMSHIPSGSLAHIDGDRRVMYYGRVKSTKEFYDDVSTIEVTTPIEITIFCDKSLEYCQKYAIDTDKYGTDEFNWWRFRYHNANSGEGSAEFKSDISPIEVIPNLVDSFQEGIAKDVKVKDEIYTNRPCTAKIKPTEDMISKYPWVLYNRYENQPPSYIYKVRFVNPTAGWSGEGKTGHTIDSNAEGKKTKKVDW